MDNSVEPIMSADSMSSCIRKSSGDKRIVKDHLAGDNNNRTPNKSEDDLLKNTGNSSQYLAGKYSDREINKGEVHDYIDDIDSVKETSPSMEGIFSRRQEHIDTLTRCYSSNGNDGLSNPCNIGNGSKMITYDGLKNSCTHNHIQNSKPKIECSTADSNVVNDGLCMDENNKISLSEGFFEISQGDNDFFEQMSNNNKYAASKRGFEIKGSIEEEDEMNSVDPEVLQDNIDNIETLSTSSLSSSEYLETAENSQEEYHTPDSDKEAKPNTNSRDDDSGSIKTFEQLNPTEVKILRSNIGEIVKTSDVGTPNFDGDEVDPTEENHSGGTPNQQRFQRSIYSANTESADSILDTDKEQEISAAEFDFASVIPTCKGTTISVKDRTSEDAQALLNQIINGEPDPCLGPDVFSSPMRSGDVRGQGRGGRGVVVVRVSSDPGINDQDQGGSQNDVKEWKEEEEMNVSLHNAVSNMEEISENGGGGCDIFPSKNSRADTTRNDVSFVFCDSLKSMKLGDGDYEEKRHAGNEGTITSMNADDCCVGDNVERKDGTIDDCSGHDGCVDNSVRRNFFHNEIESYAKDEAQNKDKNDGYGVDKVGAKSSTSVCKNTDKAGNGSNSFTGRAESVTNLGNLEKDENHKGSYMENASASSLDVSIIDSVIMENCDDGGDSCGNRSPPLDAAVAAEDGKHDECLKTETFEYNCSIEDETVDQNKIDENREVYRDDVQNDQKDVEDNHDFKSGDSRNKENETPVKCSFESCNTDDDWREFESTNVIYESNSTIKKYNCETITPFYQGAILNEIEEECDKNEGVYDREDYTSENKETKESVKSNNTIIQSNMIERQIEHNGNILPFVMPTESHQDDKQELPVEGGCVKNSSPSSVNMNDCTNYHTGTVCPCNSEVYSCEVPPNFRQSSGNHATRMNGIREILKATELFFDQEQGEDEESLLQESPPFSLENPEQVEPRPLIDKKSSRSSRAIETRAQRKNVNTKQLPSKVNAMNRNNTPSPRDNDKKWTLEKQKPVLPNISNKKKSPRSLVRGAEVLEPSTIDPGKTSNTRIRKVGLMVKKLNDLQGSQNPKPAESLFAERASHCQRTFDLDNQPENLSKIDAARGDNPELESTDLTSKSVGENKNKEVPTKKSGPSKMPGSKKRISPVMPPARTPRNVNANKTNRFPRFAEILNNLDLKKTVAISCSATSSACTMTSCMQEVDDSLFSNHGDERDNKKGEHGGKLGASGMRNFGPGWKTPVGERGFAPGLRRPKLESFTLYKPKRHLNPKNASAEEYHRYKMDLRLAQSLAKIKRGPPTVDCYLDPRLHQKSNLNADRSRSRSQKRFPEVTL